MRARTATVLFLVAIACGIGLARAKAEVPSWAKVSAEQVAAAEKLGVPVALENSVGIRFVLIPAGTFLMGSRDSAAEVARRCAMPNAQGGWFYDDNEEYVDLCPHQLVTGEKAWLEISLYGRTRSEARGTDA